MKYTSTQLIKNISFIILFIYCNLAFADQITIDTANNYPYKNLINRTNIVKVFYIENDGGYKCRVEVLLNNIKWTTVEKEVHKDIFNNDILSHCLPREKAEKILFQTFVQFGQGL